MTTATAQLFLFPIILSIHGQVMDGMHSAAKALSSFGFLCFPYLPHFPYFIRHSFNESGLPAFPFSF
jgi:hypothetical protein